MVPNQEKKKHLIKLLSQNKKDLNALTHALQKIALGQESLQLMNAFIEFFNASFSNECLNAPLVCVIGRC